ncbi:putative manganese efflux pump MntP [Clostridia bacterium]|nr:putative manganese efflux pump MntP [Clostridia bacterium]
MQPYELMLIAVSLSADAFAASICLGLSPGGNKLSSAIKTGIYFGVFQAIMPLLGYFAGDLFAVYIESFDHWIAFALLGFLGGKMIYESFKGGDDETTADGFAIKRMLTLAFATSVDAFAVGVTFAFLNVEIFTAVSVIGIVAFLLSAVGVRLGRVIGAKFRSKATFAGGAVLVLIGVKILIEHLLG